MPCSDHNPLRNQILTFFSFDLIKFDQLYGLLIAGHNDH